MKRPFRLFRQDDWPKQAPWVPLDVLARCLAVAPVRREQGNGCWIWEGARNPHGYGKISVPGPDMKGTHHRIKYLAAHRAMFAVKESRWFSKKELICHHCDVRACVNPGHLYLGTFLSNASDRRRDVSSEFRRLPANLKVTDRQIGEAIRLYFGPEGNGRAEFLGTHGWGIKTLARRYGVGDIVIRHFVYGKTRYPFCLNGKQMTEIMAMYFGKFGQGSVCPKGTNVARWTTKSIAGHLGISESTVEHALLGERFKHLRRPSLEHLKPDKRIVAKPCAAGKT